LESFEESKVQHHYYQNESPQGESHTENHSHSRCKCIHYMTMKIPLKWQTQHFIINAWLVTDL